MKNKKDNPLEQGLSILEFIRHPQLIDDQSTSLAQNVILKSCFGLPLDDTETEIYRRGTGRELYVPREQREITVLAGRKSGKTSKIGSRIALYQAFRNHQLPRNERAHILLIAPTLDQAHIAFDYIYQDLVNSPILSARIAKIRKNEIILKNRITIECCACSSISTRGKSVVAALCDEVSYWKNEVTSVHCDEQVLAALRPAMITFPAAKCIKITTPGSKRGTVWSEFQRRAELSYPVWQLPTVIMNLTVSTEMLEQEREGSLENFNREYLAEFVDNVISWIEPEILEACIARGRTELPRVSDGVYVASVDPGFKNSGFALSIAHRTSEGVIVVDLVACWTGSSKAALGFERVCREITEILRRYRINNVQGDRYAAPAIQQEFLKLGITYREVTFRRHTRAQLFNNLKHLLTQQRIELLDRPELLRELRCLEEYREADGGVDVRPAYGQDDRAIVLALCAFELSQSGSALLPEPIMFDRVSCPWDDYLRRVDASRGGYPVSGYCSKFPKCWSAGHCECYGF